MPKLFVNKEIVIHAPAQRVWDALTLPQNTDQWAQEFSSGGPRFHIESDWQLGSSVLWKGEDGTIIVDGKVTALETHKLLRYTVADTRSEKFEFSEEDGITYMLSEQDGKTHLHIRQGDFGVMPDGEKYRDMSALIWDKVLVVVKKLAEKDYL